MLAPDDRETRKMLRQLHGKLGTAEDVALMLRVPVMTVRHWEGSYGSFSEAAKSLIHLAWLLLLHPDKIGTMFDLMTWGRFAPIATRPARKPRQSFASIAQEKLVDGAGI